MIISIPKPKVAQLRREVVACISPVWSSIENAKSASGSIGQSSELSHLSLENQLLNSQMEGIYEWLLFEERIQDQMEKFKALSKETVDDLYWNEFFHRRSEELKQILETELQALPGKVIFREPSSWSSSLWINIGEKENEAVGRTIIAKNSPVVIGDSLIGVIEYVGATESRVRLITDAALVPSVRAIRGETQEKEVLQVIKSLKDRLASREDLFSSLEEKKTFSSILSAMQEKLVREKKNWYLAKGELYGASHPLWKSKEPRLKGVGFQYSNPDVEGPSRELFSGKALDVSASEKWETGPLIQEGDLLVTTGMDGVFPAGLHVAIVSKVGPLKDGDYAYEIEAKPTAQNLEDLKVVFVMPPLGFDNIHD